MLSGIKLCATGRLCVLAVLAAGFLPGCETYTAVLEDREVKIQAEPVGDYYVGRRYYTKGARFWGYLRRPRESWENSKLVIMNERKRLQPDRLPEIKVAGPSHGYDHNFEYRIYGDYSGEKVYDPNSNFILPEFVLEDYELINAEPGFLFHPKDKYHLRQLPTRH